MRRAIDLSLTTLLPLLLSTPHEAHLDSLLRKAISESSAYAVDLLLQCKASISSEDLASLRLDDRLEFNSAVLLILLKREVCSAASFPRLKDIRTTPRDLLIVLDRRHPARVELLIEAKADLSVLNQYGAYDLSLPFGRNADTAKLLMFDGFHPDRREYPTAMMLEACEENDEFKQLILQAKPSPGRLLADAVSEQNVTEIIRSISGRAKFRDLYCLARALDYVDESTQFVTLLTQALEDRLREQIDK